MVSNFGQYLSLRFEVVDADSDGTNEEIGFHETTLTQLIIDTAVVGAEGLREFKLSPPAGAKDLERGSLFLGCEEKRAAKKNISFQLEVINLPNCASMF